METNQNWLLPHGIGASELIQDLGGVPQPTLAINRREELVLFDTFAWQLWNGGLVLCKFGTAAGLCPIERLSREAAEVVVEISGELPRFWWDWPAGPIRERLRELIDVRAVLAVAEVTAISQQIDFKNHDGKTVSRLSIQRFEQLRRTDQRVISLCRAVKVRGYDEEFIALQERLRSRGFPATAAPPVEMILEQSRRRPERWSSKPECQVTPGQTTREAVRQLANASLQICGQCEAGIIDDLDTEFLHDYRVAIRRLRSTLKLIKQVYPDAATAQVLKDLSDCARPTNRLRDLDVHLLNHAGYISCLPADLAAALNQMFIDLQGEREHEQLSVSRQLKSVEYRDAMQRVTAMFDPATWWPVTLHSHAAMWDTANEVLPKRYRKICQRASSIGAQTPETKIHDLRLEAKKLRYAIEFFGPLYDEQPVNRLLKRVKKLQNELGDFNDLAVQQLSLREYGRRKSHEQAGNTALIMAIGSLLGILHRRHQEQRQVAIDSLAEFTNKETQFTMHEMIAERSRAA